MFSTPTEVAATVANIGTTLGGLFVDLFAIAPIVVALAGFYIFWRYLTGKLSLGSPNLSKFTPEEQAVIMGDFDKAYDIQMSGVISSAADLGIDMKTLNSGERLGSAEDSLYKVIALEEGIAKAKKQGRSIDPAFQSKIDSISDRAFNV